MKNLTYLLLLCLSISVFSCGDDDLVPPDGEVVLNYDGPNQSGPLLAAGDYEAAVKFPASTMADHKDKKLKEVELFIGLLPQNVTLVVYGAGADDAPGEELYSADLTSSINEGNWVVHRPTTDIVLDGEDIWVSARLVHAGEQQSIGCDVGPGVTNGDWLYDGAAGTWAPYKDTTPESVNWNIRAVVE